MKRRKGVDPTLIHASGLEPEVLLVGAILKQALVDARWDQPSQTPEFARDQAIAFLCDQHAIDWWADLMGADGEALGETLRKAAGLE